MNIFIFAGEKSGDLHGSHLMKALNARVPELQFSGVAGPLMRNLGIDMLLPMEAFEVMGITDVLKSLPKLWKNFHLVCGSILKSQPAAVVLIDYPGFNLKLAKALRKKGFTGKIVQYVSPTVWAWGQQRIDAMAATLDLLLTIYPFEKPLFQHTTLRVEYVGNPVKECIATHTYEPNWRQKLGFPVEKEFIALFPGSREGEIKRNLPILLESAKLIKQDHPERIFAISHARNDTEQQFVLLARKHGLILGQDLFIVPQKYAYEMMHDCRSAIAKSGTVTLELALHNKPSVIVYKVTWLNKLMAKYILKLKLPHFCIVNILSKQEVFPELIAEGFSAENLHRQFRRIDGPAREACIQSCQNLHALLPEIDSSKKAANAILAEVFS